MVTADLMSYNVLRIFFRGNMPSDYAFNQTALRVTAIAKIF